MYIYGLLVSSFFYIYVVILLFRKFLKKLKHKFFLFAEKGYNVNQNKIYVNSYK